MDWSVAVPVRPLAVPGAGDSPGASTSTFANGPPVIVTAALVSPSLISQTNPFDNQERMRAIQQQLLSVPIRRRYRITRGTPSSAAHQ